MPNDYRSISVTDETFEELREKKPDGVTWDYYLRECCGLGGDSDD